MRHYFVMLGTPFASKGARAAEVYTEPNPSSHVGTYNATLSLE